MASAAASSSSPAFSAVCCASHAALALPRVLAAPAASSGPQPNRAARFWSFWARIRAGRVAGTVSSSSARVVRPFSLFLSASQLFIPAFSAAEEAKMFGWRKTSFSHTSRQTFSMSKRPRSSSMTVWNTTCIRTSPSSSCIMTGSSASMASSASHVSSRKFFRMEAWVWTLSHGQPFSLSLRMRMISTRSSAV